MDPVTLAIVNGLASGVAAGITTEAVVTSLKSFKDLLKRKLGEECGVFKAIESVKEKSESDARKAVLVEEIADSGVEKDKEIIAAAEQLLKLLEMRKPGTVYNAELNGSGAIAQGKRAVAAGKDGIAVGGNVEGNINMTGK